MSSVGQGVGGVVGAVVGFFTPLGAVYGAQLGMMLGGLVDPPKMPDGPRLGELTVQTATYGAFIPRDYGTITQAGNIFWLQGDSLTETKETTSGGKGGPPEQSTYAYSATFALGLCEGPIDGIRRIWIGSDLFYDGESSDLTTIIAGNQNATTFTLYTGTDTQLPDPSIQADKGVANTSAHRGLAYIVFDGLPLEKYGNNLMQAQVKVEIVKNGSFLGPRLLGFDDIPGYPVAPDTTGYSPAHVGINDGVVSIITYDPWGSYSAPHGDVVAPSERIRKISLTGQMLSVDAVPVGFDLRRRYLPTGSTTHRIGRLGQSYVWWAEYAHSAADGAIGNLLRVLLPYGIIRDRGTFDVQGLGPALRYPLNKGDLSSLLVGEEGRYIHGVAASDDGGHVLITTGAAARSGTSADRYFVIDKDATVVSGTINNSTADIWAIGNLIQESPNGGTVIESGGRSGWTLHSSYATGHLARYFWIDSSGVMQVSESISLPGAEGEMSAGVSAGVFYAVTRTDTFGRLYRLTASPTITPSLVPLSTIVQSECLASGLLSADDIDVTELTDEVRGYKVSNMSAIRGSLDPLRSAWPFDAIQSGYKIKFKRRGSPSVATIPIADLGAREGGAGLDYILQGSRDMDTLLPKSVGVRFLDVDREYDLGEQIASRGL